jgi:RHH-type transcriptional regulator, rel operon repressor / antitoxin RelB
MTKTMISARIPEKLGEELDALAATTRRSKAYLVAEALEDYIARQGRLYREIDEAVKEADASGEYVSHERMSAWLQSWGTDNELQQPEPDIRKPPR